MPDSRQPDANSILRLLWELPGMQQQFAPSEIPENDTTEAPPLPELLLRRLPPDFSVPAAPEALRWSSSPSGAVDEKHRFEWVGDLLPRIGVVAHGFLQRIALDGPALWDAARLLAARPAIAAALRHEGVTQTELEAATARVSEPAEKIAVCVPQRP